MTDDPFREAHLLVCHGTAGAGLLLQTAPGAVRLLVGGDAVEGVRWLLLALATWAAMFTAGVAAWVGRPRDGWRAHGETRRPRADEGSRHNR